MHIGGQAVIEGVMMRNKEKFSVAVRLPNGKIKVKTEKSSPLPKILTLPIIRGTVGLGYMLKDGLQALIWSSNQQLGKDEKLTKKELFFTIATSLLFAIIIFVAVPFFSAQFFQKDGAWFNILDGLFRIILFIGYLLIISKMKDMKTLFQYHGAEHKTIYCYEAGKKVTFDNIKQFPRQHHRCGTSFLFLVLITSIIVFSFVTGAWWIKLGGRILLIPIIAGIAYELIKLGDRFHHNFLAKMLILPGLWLQEITTKEPTEKQIEVAMKALEGVKE